MWTTVITAAITSIITSFTSIIVCYARIRAKQVRLFSPFQKDFLERQVYEFLAPLDCLLNFYEADEWSKIQSEIMSLFISKYVFVPPTVLSEYLTLCSCEKVTDDQFCGFKNLVASFFNWTRRELGYSYDSSKIDEKFRPSHEFAEKRKNVIVVLILTFSFFFLIFLILLSFSGEDISKTLRYFVLIFIFSLVCFSCFFLHEKKNK